LCGQLCEEQHSLKFLLQEVAKQLIPHSARSNIFSRTNTIDMSVSTNELKTKIIESLRLQDVNPAQIEDDAPLFGTGLGLDSIDALELVVMLEKHYGIVIRDIEEGRPAFRSVRTLADFIVAKQPAR
jgi:acyl carrier protein